MSDTYIEFQETPRDNFTMIPNIVDDMGLSPYAYRLYGHIRRVAGENGACWEGARTLAKACNMSVGMVSKVKKELIEARLIHIEKRNYNAGVYDHITILNVWQRNHEHFQQQKQTSRAAKRAQSSADARSQSDQGRSPDDHGCSQGDQGRSPDDHNNIHITRSRDQDSDDDDARARAKSTGATQDPDPVLAEVARLYEQEIGGTMSPMLFDELLELTQQERDLKRWRQLFRDSVGKSYRWNWIRAVLTRPKGGAKRASGRGAQKNPGWDGRDQGTTLEEAELDTWGVRNG